MGIKPQLTLYIWKIIASDMLPNFITSYVFCFFMEHRCSIYEDRWHLLPPPVVAGNFTSWALRIITEDALHLIKCVDIALVYNR